MRDMVRFTEAKAKQENGPVVVRKLANRANIIAAITANPGSSAKELTSHLGPYSEVLRSRLSAHLQQLTTRRNKPQIKRVKLDGCYRYYPINYKLTTDKISQNRLLESAIDLGETIERHKFRGIEPEEPDNTIYAANDIDKFARYAVPQIERASFIQELEQKAMEYAWAYPHSNEILRAFVNNCKEKNNVT